jgi:hypothetical protein
VLAMFLFEQVIAIGDFLLTIYKTDENYFIVKKIHHVNNDKIRHIFLDGKVIKEGQKIDTFEFKKIRILNLFDKNVSEDFNGVFSSFTKDKFLNIDERKYYELTIDNKIQKNISFEIPNQNNDILATTFFNQVPLFYKFVIEDVFINFNNGFEITDIDGNVIENFVVQSYGNTHSVYLDIKNNNRYFWSYNGFKTEIDIFKSYYSKCFSENFNGNFIEFNEPVYIQYVNVLGKKHGLENMFLKLVTEDGNEYIVDIDKGTDNIYDIRTSDFKPVNDFIKKITLFSKTLRMEEYFNKNLSLLWYNDSRTLMEPLDNSIKVDYAKTDETDFLFFAKEFNPIKEEDIILDQNKDYNFNNKYIYYNNELVEHHDGNISFLNLDKSLFSLISNNEFVELDLEKEFLLYNSCDQEEELKKYYESNFQSVSTIIEYDKQC